MTLQDLAFEGVDSYKRKIDFANDNLDDCMAKRDKYLSRGSSIDVIADFDDMCKEWEKRLSTYKQQYADALKLYEETFC